MRNNAMEEWMALRVDYFAAITAEVFDQYLRRHGFGSGVTDAAGCLTYHRGELFFQLHYYVEDRPNFSPMVTIGLERASPLVPAFDRIGLWYAIPEAVKERDYETWTFSNASDLKEVLTRIKDDVVDVYACPLWENQDQLTTLIDRRYNEVKAERTADIVNRNKQEAERAFRAHDYEKAARIYDLMRESDLSLAERKRHEIAKKQSSQK